MSESKRTPGPWMISEQSGSVTAVNCPDNGGNIICAPPDWAWASMYYWPANARLIASAPDLLEALEFALQQTGCDGDLCTEDWHEEARSAIAKATGE